MGKKGITYTAEEYSRTKNDAKSQENSSFRNAVEAHTVFSLVGDPTGFRVLDAGCGDGLYARELIDRGAHYVVGVDCASDFVALAREKNSGYEGKIEYHQSFVQDFTGSGSMDLVVGSFVLSYPKNLGEAISYCSAMGSHLKEGGTFIGFNNNIFEEFVGERYAKYGFRKVMKSNDEGSEIHYLVDGMTDPIVNYHLKPETYEKAFEEAGFSDFEWKSVELIPSERGNSYWDEFFENEPPFIAMVARK